MPRLDVFQRDSVSLRAELSIGSGAGSDLYHRINAARESVLVVSPYLDEHLLNCLLELRERGGAVDLVTMDDSVRRHKIATKLVAQLRSRDEAAVTRRRKGSAHIRVEIQHKGGPSLGVSPERSCGSG